MLFEVLFLPAVIAVTWHCTKIINHVTTAAAAAAVAAAATTAVSATITATSAAASASVCAAVAAATASFVSAAAVATVTAAAVTAVMAATVTATMTAILPLFGWLLFAPTAACPHCCQNCRHQRCCRLSAAIFASATAATVAAIAPALTTISATFWLIVVCPRRCLPPSLPNLSAPTLPPPPLPPTGCDPSWSSLLHLGFFSGTILRACRLVSIFYSNALPAGACPKILLC